MTREIVESVGGKGYQLLFLKQAGFLVPDFYILTSEYVRSISSGKASIETIEKEIDSETQGWNAEFFAVRSSVNAEDGADHSFAGLFETFLFVKREGLINKVIEASKAIHSERVLKYCAEKGITKELSVAIVIQKMLKPTSAGVCFSRSPIKPTADILIDSSWGVGEGVVSGLVEVDHWRYSRLLDLKEERIAEKHDRISFAEGGGTIGLKNEDQMVLAPSLNLEQRHILIRKVLEIEKIASYPIDVEWAFENDQLYFLQVRPITQSFPPLKVYTDTNLAESYPGVTSPLTASFVKLAYRNVFLESAVLLGASSNRLLSLVPHYDSLIAEVDNHLYYDLEHYYAVLSALPGGKKNIENWHRMIGGKIETVDVPIKMKPLTKLEELKAVVKLTSIIFTQDKVLERFAESIEVQKRLIKDQMYKTESAQETLQLLEKTLVRPLGFGLTVINDVILMIGIKALTVLLKGHGKTEADLATLLVTGDEVESIKPMNRLRTVLSEIPSDFWVEWDQCVRNKSNWSESYPEIWSELGQKGWKNECASLAGFLDVYGDRAFEELKLESPTLKQSPHEFDRLLKFMRLNRQQVNSQINLSAKLLPDFPLLKKILWKISWKITKRSITWREHTRLLRGQFYNLIREMIAQTAKQLRSEFPVFQQFELNDFFSATIDDYRKFAGGEISEFEFAQILIGNQSWKESSPSYPEFLVIGDGERGVTSHVVMAASDLQGQAASTGNVVGIPLVIDSPNDALKIENLSDYILVTRHTDPAWVYIMSQCKGLISEKGSLLSHTAIIGRELGIPTLVGVKGALSALKGKKKIELNSELSRVVVHED